jgi:hypothetical protein
MPELTLKGLGHQIDWGLVGIDLGLKKGGSRMVLTFFRGSLHYSLKYSYFLC